MPPIEDPQGRPVRHPRRRRGRPACPAFSHALQYSLSQTIAAPYGADAAQPQPGRRASTARGAPGRSRSTGTRTSTARTASKHVTDEATVAPGHPRVLRRALRSPSSSKMSDYWLNQQGRLTEPMVKRPGSAHYEPISWDDAIGLLAGELDASRLPGRGDVLHLRAAQQRGRVPAAAVRPRLRHQQPPGLLEHVPRVERVGARRDARRRQGHGVARGHLRGRPGARRGPEPRAPTTRGCSPRWSRPSTTAARWSRSTRCPRPGSSGSRTRRSRAASSGGVRRSPTSSSRSASAATWRCSRCSTGCCSRPRTTAPGTVLDQAFIERDTTGFEAFAEHVRKTEWDDVLEATGLTREEIEELRERVLGERQDHRVLGDGADPAPARRADDPRDRQLPAAAGQHRSPRGRRVPGPRPQQRAGRPHHGHLGAAAGAVPGRRSRRSSASRRRPSPATTRSTACGRCGTARRRSSSASPATSSARCRTARSPRTRCGAAG